MKLRPILASWVLMGAVPAQASNHFVSIVEVFPGTVAQPTAQYVVLQSFFTGQNFLAGQSLHFYDRNNVLVGTATFPANNANGANQAKYLVSTAAAATLFNVTADLVMANPNVIPSGGKICWDTTLFGTADCVAWGDNPGTAGTVAHTDTGTPFSKPYGLALGDAMVRRLDVSGSPTALDAADDTDNCKNDFLAGTPAPKNSANQTGTPPSPNCGNDQLDGLEQCDDGGTMDGDGCSSTCRIEPDGIFRDGHEGF